MKKIINRRENKFYVPDYYRMRVNLRLNKYKRTFTKTI